MITENMGLVYMVAKRFANRGTDLQDLTQIGVIGLIKAIDRFDTSLSYSFSTYAVPLIMGEIRRFLRDDGMIHTSRQMKEHARKIAIVREQMKKTQNKEPTLQELAEKTGIAIEDLEQALQPFFTTKPELERSGMGFSFMEAFMDRIEVRSKKGEGTRVVMWKYIEREREQ